MLLFPVEDEKAEEVNWMKDSHLVDFLLFVGTYKFSSNMMHHVLQWKCWNWNFLPRRRLRSFVSNHHLFDAEFLSLFQLYNTRSKVLLVNCQQPLSLKSPEILQSSTTSQAHLHPITEVLKTLLFPDRKLTFSMKE